MSALFLDGGYIRERRSKCYVAALHEGAQPYRAMFLAAPETLEALRELLEVCIGMDAEQQGERPTEDRYQAAVAAAADSLAKAKGAV